MQVNFSIHHIYEGLERDIMLIFNVTENTIYLVKHNIIFRKSLIIKRLFCY
jgi:hypothetical protein